MPILTFKLGRTLVLSFGFLLLGILVFSALLRANPSVQKQTSEAVPLKLPVCDFTKKVELGESWDRCSFAQLLKPETLSEAPKQILWTNEGRRWTAELSFDEDLQRFIEKKLRQYRVDWGAVVVVDAPTGEILALASHSEKDANSGNLALRATFPAASVFKIVTATAALEQKLAERTSLFRYRIRFRRDEGMIRRSDLVKEGGNNAATMEQAFAKSENKVFGKIGLRIGETVLLDYAHRFGFNVPTPFEFTAENSTADSSLDGDSDEDEEIVEQARLAAGFKGATLSPLHGALIAAAVANRGRMMLPHLIRRVTDSDGKEVYRASPRVWTVPMTEETSRELRLMMGKTILQGGTAHKGFRRIDRDPILGKLSIGGKTGSLTGTNPPGKNLWFVGYAQGYDRVIAIGIVLVHDRVWHVKPSQLSREIMNFYFAPKPVLEARAKGPTNG